MNAVKTPSCDEVQLEVLLFGDEDSAEFKQAANHVERCSSCRDRLTGMASDEKDWAEVRSVLQQDERSAPSPSFKLDFLSPPSHPEMLGRLGRYEIGEVIGSGGMGIVLKGFDTELNRPVAIKVLAPHLAHSGAARQRFAREARAAAAIVHEHVVAIHNVESEDEVPFLVMQYVPGRSLAERVDHDGPLEAAEILRIGMQAAAGLAAAHAQGVIHRDIKPANILLENGVERALLTDFGLARAAEDASLTRSGIIAGTPHYMSPEQARGEPVDFRSDLFSLGSVLYFMATGHPPFRAEQAMAVLHRICNDRYRPVWAVNPRLPDELEEVIDRLLQKRPGRRYGTAIEAHQALARALSQVQQPGRGRGHYWLRRLRRHPGSLRAAAAVALAIAILGWLPSWIRPAAIGANGPSNASDANSASDADRGDDAPATQVLAPGPPTSAQKSAREFHRQQVEFAQELAAIDQSLKLLSNSPYPEAIAVGAIGDSWARELKAMNADVTRWENAWSVGPTGNFSLGKVKGEKP